MKKKNKGNHRNNNAGSGSYPAVSGCFLQQQRNRKTELKTDRKEQITSEQETKEAYEAAGKRSYPFGTAMQTAGIILNSVQWIIMPKPVSQWESVM